MGCPSSSEICHINNTGVFAAEGDLASNTVQTGGLRVSHDYDLTKKDKLDEYWARLEYASLAK